MFTLTMFVNGTTLKRIDAVRQSDKPSGWNDYRVFIGGRDIGTISHYYEDGKYALAHKLLVFANEDEEKSSAKNG